MGVGRRLASSARRRGRGFGPRRAAPRPLRRELAGTLGLWGAVWTTVGLPFPGRDRLRTAAIHRSGPIRRTRLRAC